MTVDTRLVAVGVALLLSSSLIFLPTGVGASVSAALAGVALVGLVAGLLGDDGRRTA